MEKCNNNLMDLNRETAMRLWVKTYGKETKVHDFAGRRMVKGAYNINVKLNILNFVHLTILSL